MRTVHTIYRSLSLLFAAGLLGGGVFVLLAADAAGNITQQTPTGEAGRAGWYTQAQASKGEILYNTYCAECHRPDLSGAMGPALVGKKFVSQWKTLGDLYGFEHANMPATNPGSVPDRQLTKITAYILSKNGFVSGDTPLTASGEMMGRALKP